MIGTLQAGQAEAVALSAFLGALAFAMVVIRPQLGAYVFLVANPLIVGIARGDAIPFLRPNEILLLFIVAALSTRSAFLVLARRPFAPAISRIDLALVALASASSVVPLLVRFARDLPVSTDDLLYSFVLWKYYLLYRIFRSAVSTPSQVGRCLMLSMASAAVVAVVAILQVEDLFGVPEFLYTYYDQPFEGHTTLITDRGTSTVASSLGLADVMIMNFVIAIALLRHKQGKRWLLFAGAGLFMSGCIVAGAFSGFIGLGVAVLAFGVISRRLSRILSVGVPAALAASIAFWSVITERLSGFQEPSGLPLSWSGRWNNLQDFFFPELFSNFGWVLGVRPAARLPAPDAWREWVYIESGYVWLLWIGGIPLLAAFLYFVWIAAQDLRQVVRHRTDAIGVAAVATLAYLMVIVTLMLFDPHITVRGSADLFFPLLALSFAGAPVAQHHASASRARAARERDRVRASALPYSATARRRPFAS